MVAKAKGDLFDFTVGGAGFHVTAHLIALAALFIACFAIAGYISYRGDSIPGDALKEDDISVASLEMGNLVEKTYYKRFSTLGTTAPGAANDSIGAITGALPVGSFITSGIIKVVTPGANLGNLQFGLGTLAQGAAFGNVVTGTAIGGLSVDADGVAGTQGRMTLDNGPISAAGGQIPCLIVTNNTAPNNSEVFEAYLTVVAPKGLTLP